MKYKWDNPSGSYVKLKISKNPWYKDYNLNGFVNLKKYNVNINLSNNKLKKKNNYKNKKNYNNKHINDDKYINNKNKFKNKYIVYLLLLILVFFIIKY